MIIVPLVRPARGWGGGITVRVRLNAPHSAPLWALLSRDEDAKSYFDCVQVSPPEDDRLYNVAMTEWTMKDLLKYILFDYFFENRRHTSLIFADRRHRRHFSDVCVAEAAGEGGKVRFLVNGTLAVQTLPDEDSPAADVTTNVNLQLRDPAGRPVRMNRRVLDCLEGMAMAAGTRQLNLELYATVAGK